MSKKPKRSRHRIPDCALELRADPIDERYQWEIDQSVAHLERRYQKAQKALEAAERRVENVRLAIEAAARTGDRRRAERDYDKLQLIVEERRRELREVERLMKPAVSGRDGRRRQVRHDAGVIDIPLGETAARWKRSNKPLRLPEEANR